VTFPAGEGSFRGASIMSTRSAYSYIRAPRPVGPKAGTVPELEVLYYCEHCSTVFLDGRDAAAHGTISAHSVHKLAPVEG
jgi:hypothetical protein